MVERGFYPDFSEAALAELKRIPGPARADGKAVRDMRDRLWASIDNDDSLDLDQLTTAETPTETPSACSSRSRTWMRSSKKDRRSRARPL